jgi:hypothetical protein
MSIKCTHCTTENYATLKEERIIAGKKIFCLTCLSCCNDFFANEIPTQQTQEQAGKIPGVGLLVLSTLKHGQKVVFENGKYHGTVYEINKIPSQIKKAHGTPHHEGVVQGKAIYIDNITDYAYGILRYTITKVITDEL